MRRIYYVLKLSIQTVDLQCRMAQVCAVQTDSPSILQKLPDWRVC
jgi:hypothetical protein